MQQAVIYCRVSSKQQVTDGHGLEGQESSCKKYILEHGYKYLKTFKDGGISGAEGDRNGMEEMFEYLSSRGGEIVVVVDDLKRWARDVAIHWALKEGIKVRGCTLESPNFNFEDTPTGHLVETMQAAMAQLEREENRAQVIRRQRARLEAGYWPFTPVLGYKSIKDPIHGKLLVPDEPRASLIREGLEAFADDILITKTDLKRFLESKGFSDMNKTKKVSLDEVDGLLKSVIYAGKMEYVKPPLWNVTVRNAHHKALISMNTYNKIQDKLNGKRRASFYMGLRNSDFPLRDFVVCSVCGKEMTASWNTGRHEKYPNYWCKTKGCPQRYKTCNRDKMNDEFIYMLETIKPDNGIVELNRAIAKTIWESGYKNKNSDVKKFESEIGGIDEEIELIKQRIKRTKHEEMIDDYENDIIELKKKKVRIKESLADSQEESFDIGTALELSVTFLENPVVIWKEGNYETRRLVPRLLFEENLPYIKGQGFGTASLSVVLKFLGAEKNNLEMGGVEPPYKEKELE